MSKIKINCDGNKLKATDLDKALTAIPYGRFHYKIMASCALCLLSSGLQNGISAYLLPAAKCELNLQSTDIGFINAAFLIGGTCSSFLWGIVADLAGRKKVLIVTLLLDVLVTIICTLMQELGGLIACRFISGFLMGGPGSITFSYLAEFHAPQHQSKSIYYSGSFYTLSWLMLPILSQIILPLQIDLQFGSYVMYSSWRILLLVLTIPELIAGIWLIYLPESPKFLAISNHKEAIAVLKQMYNANTGKNGSDFPIEVFNTSLNINNKLTAGATSRGKILRLIQDIYLQLTKLFGTTLLFPTLLVSGIMFANMFGYFGMGLWLPEILKIYQSYENVNSYNFTTDKEDENSCGTDFNGMLFVSSIVMGLTSLCGNFLSGWFAGKLDNKTIPLITMLFGGSSTILFYWLNSSYQTLIVASIFQATMATANIAVGSVTVELFPTSVTAMAISTVMLAGRVGAIICNIIFGYLMETHSEIAIFLVAGVLLFGAALCLVIPRRINSPNELSQKEKLEISIISTPL